MVHPVLFVTEARFPLYPEHVSWHHDSQRIEYDGDGPVPLQLVVGVITSAHLTPDNLDRVVTPDGARTLKQHGRLSKGGSKARTETELVTDQAGVQKEHDKHYENVDKSSFMKPQRPKQTETLEL